MKYFLQCIIHFLGIMLKVPTVSLKNKTEKKPQNPVELHKPKYTSYTDRHCFNLLHGST